MFQNAKSQNFKVGVSQNWLLYQTKSLQKELGFFLQNCGTAQFLKFGLFLHCKNELKRAQNVQNSEFAYYASKSGKCIKQTPTPPFWGDVGVKKWSQFLDSGTQSPIFGHLTLGTFAKNA